MSAPDPVRRCAERYRELGYSLVRICAQDGKGPREPGWHRRAFHPEELEPGDRIGLLAGPSLREEWVRGLRDQCLAAGVPFFYKQRAERGHKISMPTLDGRQWAQQPGGATRPGEE